MKKQVRVHFVDFWEPFDAHDNLWLDILKKEYDVVMSPEAPDFLFHSCFGHDHIRFDCVKICIMGENITPDFNVSDYACGFDHIVFEDRYYRMPLYRLYMGDEAYREYDADFFNNEAAEKTKFCNFLYSNARNANPLREQFFERLSEYQTVDSGGGFRNNIKYRVEDKYKWQRQYKFSIAFENSSKNGYTTEKIYDALRAHTIPIYWGNPRVAEEFNSQRFINCHDYPSFEAVIGRIKELDDNPVLYREMLSQPWFAAGPPPLPLQDAEYGNFILSIFRQGPEKAHRTTRNGASSVHYWEQCWLKKTAPLCSFYNKVHNKLFKVIHSLLGKQ